MYIYVSLVQISSVQINLKGKDDEIEELQISKKKSTKEMEALQTLIDELRGSNSKLEKSRKRLQEEVIVDTLSSDGIIMKAK